MVRKRAIALSLVGAAALASATITPAQAGAAASGVAFSLDLHERLSINVVGGVGGVAGSAQYQQGEQAPIAITLDCAEVFPGYETGPFVHASGTTADGQRYYLYVGEEGLLEQYGKDTFAVTTTATPGRDCEAPIGKQGIVWMKGYA